MPTWSRDLFFDEPKSPEQALWDRTPSEGPAALCPCAVCYGAATQSRTTTTSAKKEKTASSPPRADNTKSKSKSKSKIKTQSAKTNTSRSNILLVHRLRRQKSAVSMASDFVPLFAGEQVMPESEAASDKGSVYHVEETALRR